MKIFWNSRGEKVTWQNSAFLLLLLLSCFSCVRPSVTPWTAAHQAPPSMGFSRQEYWSGVPLVISAAKSLQSCPTLCDPIDGSPPGSRSLGFSRQEHWSGLPFPSPMHESEKWKGSRSVISNSLRPHGLQPTRLLCPWDFPDKSTGVGRHCLLQLSLMWLKNGIIFPLLTSPASYPQLYWIPCSCLKDGWKLEKVLVRSVKYTSILKDKSKTPRMFYI